MCLYPRIIANKKYQPNKKNGGIIPAVLDERVLHVPIGCQECIECRKQKAREWQVRLQEDIKEFKNGQFVTLTLSDQSYTELYNIVLKEIKQLEAKIDLNIEEKESFKRYKTITGYGLDNEIATLAVRRFTERWRKKHTKSIRHWLITELGHQGTENIHLHGIIYTNDHTKIEKYWKYGFVWDGYTEEGKRINYVNNQTINYCTKYVMKQDEDHPSYKPKILCSDGIGAHYQKTLAFTKNKFNGNKTNETYRTETGHKISLPIYLRNKIYNEKEREELWIQKLDKQERWVCGEKINISKTDKNYYKALEWHRKRNTELGYGTGKHEWNKLAYELKHREIMQETRIKKASPAGS